MFIAALFSVFVSCKKQRKGHEVELMAIIKLDDAQSFTQNMYGKRNLGPWACHTIALKRIKWRSYSKSSSRVHCPHCVTYSGVFDLTRSTRTCIDQFRRRKYKE